jgi:AmmeMemoRadiSam system protein B/AmmeMemoRadiSam system protein A
MKKVLLATTVVAAAAIADAASRPPAVAGGFYAADPGVLRKRVQTLLENVPRPVEPALALVAPHAGYVYSGATAAEAFARLDGAKIQRIILLGPSHHVGFGGGALPAPGITAFTTPLGEVALDRDALDVLRRQREYGGPGDAHDPEHSLEVELPFLQVVAPGAKIVPILVGFNTDRDVARRMAKGLRQLLDGRTAVVVSSDFTHHGANYGYEPFVADGRLGRTLLGVGRTTGGRLAAADADGFWYQVEVSGDTVCGRRPLAVLSELLAHAFEGSGRVLDVTTSGHVSGSWDFSVTYVAVAFNGRWTEWTEPDQAPELGRLQGRQGEELLRLARATLESHLVHDASLADWFANQSMGIRLKSKAGAFVTVHNLGDLARREGRLRACMGVIEARQPLLDAVIQAAVSAAHDPRFPPLEKSELAEVELEVSVLSPTRRVSGPQAIRVGEHGVVLHKGGRSAVFLPQVAVEQGWDRATMLDHLSRKAGLSEGAWREGAEFEVFTAQVFAEGS